MIRGKTGRRCLALPVIAVLCAWLGAAAPGGPGGMARAQETRRLDDAGQFQKQTTFDPKTPEGRIQRIRTMIAEDRGGKAEDLADEWIEEYPDHPQIDEAYLLRGDAKVAQRDYYQALFDYEYLVRSFPGSQHFVTALEREFQIATLYAGGLNRKFLGLAILPADGEAEELFVRIQERAPGSEIGERASLALADFYFETATMYKAVDAYDLFLQNYPQSQHRRRVMRRLIQSSLATFKGPKYDPTGLLDAATRLRAYRQEFPADAEQLGADALLVRIDESLALKAFYIAEWYEQRSKNVSAIFMYKQVVKDHPRTAAAQQAIRKLGQLDPQTKGYVVEEGKREEAKKVEDVEKTAAEPPKPVDEKKPVEEKK